MTDSLSPDRRTENMRRIKSKGMKPELIVRQLAHRLGFRFRLHRKDLPGKPDLVFPSRKKIILVNGCFWHGHDDPNCVDGRRKPKTNLDYWLPKLARNQERDRAQQAQLTALGWSILVIWECQTRGQNRLAERLKEFLN